MGGGDGGRVLLCKDKHAPFTTANFSEKSMGISKFCVLRGRQHYVFTIIAFLVTVSNFDTHFDTHKHTKSCKSVLIYPPFKIAIKTTNPLKH